MMNLTAIAERAHRHDDTGIYVRANGPDGSVGNYDIAELDSGSLLRWLRSRGGQNAWAENTVLILLGHDPVADII